MTSRQTNLDVFLTRKRPQDENDVHSESPAKKTKEPKHSKVTVAFNFREKWRKEFPWLEYSTAVGMTCFTCVQIAMNILNSGRFSMGSSGAGILKKLIGMTAEHAISRTQFGSKLCEFKLIKEKFAKMAVTTYAMESMAYLTAGIIDMYEKPDLSVEAAMVKIFSSEGCWMCVNECLQVLGGLGFMKDYPYERYLRDARILMIFEGTNEILRLYVSLTGLKHAGQELKELVRKLRDPLYNPGLVFLQVWNRMSGKLRDKPKLTLRLNEEVHPSLKNQTEILEECTLQFQRMVEIILQRHGNKVVHEQLELKRLSDICIDLYAMTACIGRTSRAYCLGLRNADHELLLTKAFCHEAYARVQQNLTAMREGKTKNNDDTYMAIAETVFQNKGFAAEHPLTVNW